MLVKCAYALLLVVAVACLSGCAKDPARYVLFPTAAKVRVYGAPSSINIRVDKSGHVSADTAVKDGGWLTHAEIGILRAAVRIAEPPAMGEAACCFPRHAFLFYDASNHYLGHLAVCFECGCAEIFPEPPMNKTLNWIDWDRSIIAHIVEVHGLGPLVPPRGR